ncbi:MAG: HAMP domain-containing histidine kinase [Burkholderiales bacterium]|nr:HAMP domain-containing histidine kinase [Burkholderiales bacterium]
MHAHRSLRFKVAVVFSMLTIALLVAQALGVRTLAEAQEERLITALVDDDMASVIKAYRSDSALLPPFDSRLRGYVSSADRLAVALPSSVAALPDGVHEIILNGREIHVAAVPFNDARLYRVYNFSAYERRFKRVIDALMAVTGLFALLTIWLAFGLSGLLVRQVAGLAKQVKTLGSTPSAPIQPGRYDETELVALVDAFNEYHHRMAAMIEREKEFTGNVSHELRTPLTAIKTSCELLEQDASIGAKARARIAQIDRAADNMRRLVNALLTLAREHSVRDTVSVPLAAAIGEALTPFADRLAAKGIDTRVEIEPELCVTANPSALAIVLSNLIDNAERHMTGGHLSFTYAQPWLRIEDTGSGIAPHAAPHVFDRFYQAHPIRHAQQGAGIGLAIVKKIAERYGWQIRLDSEPTRGTSVSLLLPRPVPGQATPERGRS